MLNYLSPKGYQHMLGVFLEPQERKYYGEFQNYQDISTQCPVSPVRKESLNVDGMKILQFYGILFQFICVIKGQK